MTFAKILVPLDGSRVAEAALPKAEELVRGHPEATLLLLRAVEAKVFPGVDPIDAQVSVVHEAEDSLESVAERLRASRVPTVRTSVWYGEAAAILDTARRRKPDLIVMSTHGQRGMTRLIAGSVAESVLRQAHVPVLMMRLAPHQLLASDVA
ncbi:MAG TPA: universal stress protein [Methylomirabilota bacterium]|jgi:nucleotide-binding universal stress UspA family protein